MIFRLKFHKLRTSKSLFELMCNMNNVLTTYVGFVMMILRNYVLSNFTKGKVQNVMLRTITLLTYRYTYYIND